MRPRANYYCEVLNKIIWKVPMSVDPEALAAEANDLLQYHKSKKTIRWNRREEKFELH